MEFLKKNWSNLLFILVIILLIVPQSRKPIQIALNRIIAVSPTKISEGKRTEMTSYNWTLSGLEGTVFNFENSRGKVVLVNLWATWCPPCIAEMPSFQKLYQDYGDRVNFYFVSSEKEDKLKRFLEKKQYDLPVYRPITGAPEQMRSKILPTTYVISKTGEIVVAKKGAANWNDRNFRELLDELLLE